MSVQPASDKCPNCGANVAGTTIRDKGGFRCPHCGHHCTAPSDPEQLKKLWERSMRGASRPDVTLKPVEDGTRTMDIPAKPGEEPSDTATISGRLSLREQTVAPSSGHIQPPPHYELLQQIGEGGMGVVHRARQTSADRLIALKMIKPEYKRDRKHRSGFLSEAVATANLDHPGIVPVYDVGSSNDGTVFYAMKEVRGMEWKKHLPGKTLNENLEILMRVCDAVAFAHSRGVIHRDLKPENVMLGDYGEVLVMDWGLAVAVTPEGKADKLDPEHAIGGTVPYMAPEMALGQAERIGIASDVYLLGAILFEIITGKRPHAGQGMEELLLHAAENRIVETGVTGELMDIAVKAMATEPSTRYGSVKELQEAIRGYQAHEASLATLGRARERLGAAQQSQNYTDFSHAVVLFEEAVSQWAGNVAAKAELTEASLKYADCAFRKGDLDLAASLLNKAELSHAALLERIAREKTERERRAVRLRVLTAIAVILVIVTVGVFVGASLRIKSEQAQRAVAELNKVSAEKKSLEMERQRQEEWIPVVDTDFSDGKLPAGFEAVVWANPDETNLDAIVRRPVESFFVHVEEGKLAFFGGSFPGPLMLRYTADLGEDVRVDAVVVDTGSLSISVAGDTASGYRNLLDTKTRTIWIDRGGNKNWEVLQKSTVPLGTSVLHAVRVEKVGQFVRMWVDGVQHIDFFDPLPMSGTNHNTVAIGNWGGRGQLDSLKVWRRRSPEVIPVLEAGRELLRGGALQQAITFFRNQVRTHTNSITGTEAAFLLGVALQGVGRYDEALDKFACIRNDPGSGDKARYLYYAAARERVRLHMQRDDFGRAVDVALQTPEQDLRQELALFACNGILGYLRRHGGGVLQVEKGPDIPSERQDECLRLLARLPGVREMDFNYCGLDSIAGLGAVKCPALLFMNNSIEDFSPIRHSGVVRLDISNNRVNDLTALRGLALESLNCGQTGIRDLEPLRGMQLVQLNCSQNQVTNLSPLAGMPIQELTCANNAIYDLSPLAGMPLKELVAGGNRFRDLTPLKGMPLTKLNIDESLIQDLEPLRGMKLITLGCYGNQITNLAPLTGMPLTQLVCVGNRIRDLRPLAGMPLQMLFCSDNQIESLEGLAGLPLAMLNCGQNPLRNLDLLRGLSLKQFICRRAGIKDLSPLGGMKLTTLYVPGNPISDLTPLQGMPLDDVWLGDTAITNLEPLAGMSVQMLDIAGCTNLMDLSPLRGMPLDNMTWDARLLTPQHRPILAGLPLQAMTVRGTLDEAGARFATGLPSLRNFNEHKIEHARRTVPDVFKALRGERVNLRTLACSPTNGFQWLSVPCMLPLDRAAAFAREQGGYLACPSTPAKRAALDTYAKQVTDGGRRQIVVDAAWTNGQWFWASGETWEAEARWYSPEDQQMAEETGVMLMSLDAQAFMFGSKDPRGPRSFCLAVIEWKVN